MGEAGKNYANYLAKGRLIGIQGRIQTVEYEDKQGNKRFSFDVVSEKTEFLEWGDKNEGNNNSNNASNNNGVDGDGFHPVDDDEILF